MSEDETYDVFISYSRNDQVVADSLARLIGLRERRVFLDTSDIAPGDSWPQTIVSAVKNSKVLMLLHCCDSASSPQVTQEIDLAQKFKKTIVPVLLCSAPIRDSVRELQWIDLRRSVRHSCEHAEAEVPSRLASVRKAATSWISAPVLFAVWVGIVLTGSYFNGTLIPESVSQIRTPGSLSEWTALILEVLKSHMLFLILPFLLVPGMMMATSRSVVNDVHDALVDFEEGAPDLSGRS